MLTRIEKYEHGYKAIFEREIKHFVQAVWPYFTNNEKLPPLFPELRVEELKKGGYITFDIFINDIFLNHCLIFSKKTLFNRQVTFIIRI